MIVDHIGGKHSWLYAITGGDRFFVSAAEVFVFISGLVMGIVYTGMIARQGLGAALMKALRLAWTLYMLTVTLTLIFAALSLQLGLGWAPEWTAASLPDLILSILTLHRTYYLVDVLLLYTLLILGAVPVFVLLAHGQTRLVLAGSWGLWALWQLAPQHAAFPWSIADNSVFNFPAWQVLFITALVIGYHRQQLQQRWARVSAPLVLSLSGLLVAGVIGLYAVTQLPAFAGNAVLIDLLFGKLDLRIGRLIVFAGLITCAFSLLTVAWVPIYRGLRWLLLPLGQNALSAYTWHLFVLALLMKVRPLIVDEASSTAAHNTLLQLAGLVLIWTIIMLQPAALTQLRACFAKVKGLLAVGCEHLYVPVGRSAAQ